MKNSIGLLLIFLSLISCAKKNDSSLNNYSAAMDTSKTYLALGDSYTIGEAVTEEERFPVQTIQLLKDSKAAISPADIVAVTGWTTADLIDALNVHPPKKNYSLVTLLIGVNNQYQGKSLEEYKTQFAELLSRAVSYAGNIKNHVFVLSIPDYSVTPFAQGSDTAKIAHEIDAFNEANKTISTAMGVHYIDITPISRNAKNDPSLVAADGLHPSGIQYKQWSGLLAPLMLQELK